MLGYEIRKALRQRMVRVAIILFLLCNGLCLFYQLFAQDESGVSLVQQNAVAESYAESPLEVALEGIDEAMSGFYAALFAENGDIENVDYQQLAAYAAEYERLSSLWTYDTTMQEIKDNLYSMRNTGLFGSANSYTQRLAALSYTVYDQLEIEELTADAPYGVDLMVNNHYTRMLSLLCVVALCLVIGKGDVENRMALLLFTKKKGNYGCAVAKLGGVAVFVVLMNLLFYLCNLAGALYLGLGDLGRPIQSVTGFYECALAISVGEYLLLFLALRILSDLIVAFLCCVLLHLFFDEKWTCVLMAGIFAVEILLYHRSTQLWWKFGNLFAFGNPTSYLGAFKGICFISRPVSLFPAVVVLMILLLILFAAGGILLYGHERRLILRANNERFVLAKKRLFTPKSLIRYEFRKVMILCGGGLISLVFLGAQIYFWTNASQYVYPLEYYYNEYIERFGGEPTAEKWETMLEEQSEIDYDLFVEKLDNLLEAGEITEQYYNRHLADFSENLYRVTALEMVMEQYRQVEVLRETGIEATVINRYPWDMLMGEDGLRQNLLCLLGVILASVLLFSGYGIFEKSSGMEVLIATSVMGNRRVRRKKRIPVICTSLLLSALGIVPRLLFLVNRYSYAEGQSLACGWTLTRAGGCLTLISLASVFVLGFFLIGVGVGLLSWKIAGRTNRFSKAVMLNLLLFGTPPLVVLIRFWG